MNKLFSFLKDRIITGTIILVPATIIVLVLNDVIQKVIEITAPITARYAIGGPIIESIIALSIAGLALLVILLFLGIIFKTAPGLCFQDWLQHKILLHIPLYKTLRGITMQVTGAGNTNYPVVEVDLYNSDTKTIGIKTDTLSDGRCVVYFPFAPTINIGQVNIVPSEKVEVLNISLKDASDLITQIGFDASSLYPKS